MSGQYRSGQVRTGHVKLDHITSCPVRLGQDMFFQFRSRQISSMASLITTDQYQVWSGQDLGTSGQTKSLPGQVRSCEVRSDQIRSGQSQVR